MSSVDNYMNHKNQIHKKKIDSIPKIIDFRKHKECWGHSRGIGNLFISSVVLNDGDFILIDPLEENTAADVFLIVCAKRHTNPKDMYSLLKYKSIGTAELEADITIECLMNENTSCYPIQHL